MEECFAKLKGWTLCGAILNWVAAALCAAALLAGVAAAVALRVSASSVLYGIIAVDPESVVAGYEILGRLAAGGGLGLLYLLLLVGILLLLVPLALSLIPAILGTVWLKTHTLEQTAAGFGRGNMLIRVVANGILSAVFLLLLVEMPSAAAAAALLLQLLPFCTHIRCLFLLSALRSLEEGTE